MIEWFRELSHWMLDFADSDLAILVLAISSFTESIFFPIPPDPLLIGIAVRQPENAIWLAALVTVSSVAGAFVGHWLGQRFGRPLLRRIVSEKKIEAVERMFSKYGAWAILVAAFTPIPYKVFTITAGMLGMNRRSFLIASFIGRGARFFLLGGLIFVLGDEIEVFIEDNFELMTGAFAAAFIVGLAIFLVIRRRRAGNPAN